MKSWPPAKKFPRIYQDRYQEPGSTHIRIKPKRRQWKQFTVLRLWRCPICRASIAPNKRDLGDIYAHELYHAELDEMLNELFDRIEELEERDKRE